uniref:Organic cation transporter protein n=1 Tax=Cacopsylla melanoneura TaxID=428564 RepID=A0A8D8ZDD1_9HEMI
MEEAKMKVKTDMGLIKSNARKKMERCRNSEDRLISQLEVENQALRKHISAEVNEIIDQAIAKFSAELISNGECNGIRKGRNRNFTQSSGSKIQENGEFKHDPEDTFYEIPLQICHEPVPIRSLRKVSYDGRPANDLSRKSEDTIPDFETILIQVGEFGNYQKILFLAMFLFAFSEAFLYLSQIFITLIPDGHWCKVPQLSNLTIEQRKLLSIPLKDSKYDSCRMYSVNYTDLLRTGITLADPTWPTTECQHGWEYDFSEIPYSTIATELNWVCDQNTLAPWAQASFFCGAIVGGLVFGWIADRFGRVPALVLTNFIGFVFGTMTAFSTTFWQFAVCRFFVGLAFDNCFTMMYIITLEYVGPTWRTFVSNMSIAVFFTLAESLLPWIAYYVANWKWLCIWTSLPLLVGVGIGWIVPESARWLLSQGRVDETISIMRRFEKMNNKHVDEKIYESLKKSCQNLITQDKDQKRYSVLDLFRSARLRNVTCLLIVIWMSISLLFDGHVRQVEHLGLDFFITFTIASATELPADTLLTFTLDKWGRRWYAAATMILSGVFSLMSCSFETGRCFDYN